MKWLVMLVALFAGRAAFANYPVFDATNFANAVRSYQTMVQQVQTMRAQVTQLQDTYKSMSGSRGLGDVLYNPALKQYLPEDWQGVYDGVAAGQYAGISGSVRDIERAERLSGTVAEQIDRMQQRSRNTTATNKALGLRAFDGAKARLNQIEGLMHQVNLTKDAKGVAEIQARIAAEQAAVQNEATKLQLIQMLQQAEEKLEAQQRHEAAQKILGSANTRMPECCSAR